MTIDGNDPLSTNRRRQNYQKTTKIVELRKQTKGKRYKQPENDNFQIQIVQLSAEMNKELQ